VPTVDELKAVHDIPEADGPKKDKALALKLWYFDAWLPHCGGCDHYGVTIRPYVLATEPKILPNGDTMKEPNVTVQGEAFGLVMLDNCRDKWIAIFQWRDINGYGQGVNLPKYNKDNEDTHKLYDCKWSDNKVGKGTGWKPAAGRALKEYCKFIDNIRRKDAKEDNVRYELGKQLLREHHEVTAENYSKKRKRKAVKITSNKESWDDDVESDWSVASD